MRERRVTFSVGDSCLVGDLSEPPGAEGLVIFAHGSGSNRKSSRNRFVAARLHEAKLATFLLDLLTGTEESLDARNGTFRFDIPLLAQRLGRAIRWLSEQPRIGRLPLGLYGASTGAAAALEAAAENPLAVRAVVSRGGRPDLAVESLAKVRAPTLLLVGENDGTVIDLNQAAFERLGSAHKRLEVIGGASHLFEEPGTLDRVAELSAQWFWTNLAPSKRRAHEVPALRLQHESV